MSLPSEVRKHQTVWIDVPGGRTAAVRYEMDGDRLVCFGDDGLSSIAAGTKVTASLGGLADGPLDAMFWAYVREMDPEGVSLSLLSDLVGDRSLGRTSEEVVRNLEAMRRSRRLVTLEA
jgi:hypothetical protein